MGGPLSPGKVSRRQRAPRSRLSASSVTITNGYLSVVLVPTTNASPGAFYTVQYASNDGTTLWTEYWQVASELDSRHGKARYACPRRRVRAAETWRRVHLAADLGSECNEPDERPGGVSPKKVRS